MGFIKRWDVNDVIRQIRAATAEAGSPYNDGFTACSCKHDLYRIKCMLEDTYPSLPTFVGEDKWEQERMIEILKKK